MSNPQQSEFRQRLTEVIAGETGVTLGQAKEVVNVLLSTMVEFIRTHESTEIRGFGAFRWVTRKERNFTSGMFGKKTIPSYDHLCFRSKLKKGSDNGNS